MKPTEVIVTCPNCSKESVKAFHYPSYTEHSTSRISAGKKTKYYPVPERYEIISGCEECGKTKKELMLIEKQGKLTPEEKAKRWKEQGLPTRIEG